MAVGRSLDVSSCDIKRYEKGCFCDLVPPKVCQIPYLFAYGISRFCIYSRYVERFLGFSALVLFHCAYYMGRDREAVGSKRRPTLPLYNQEGSAASKRATIRPI